MTRTCTGCGQALPLAAFTAKRRRQDGSIALQARCRSCVKAYHAAHNQLPEIRERRRQLWAAYYANHKPESRSAARKHYRTNRGLDARREVECRLATKQQMRCALCDAGFVPSSSCTLGYHFDHDHTTGAARGLLCSTCNKGLGLFRDNPRVLELAAIYLRNGGVCA